MFERGILTSFYILPCRSECFGFYVLPAETDLGIRSDESILQSKGFRVYVAVRVSSPANQHRKQNVKT
jgi:hypothetical protein